MTMNRFLLIWSIWVLFFLSCAVMITYLVDPYWMYSDQAIQGINEIKPKAGTHSRLAKIYQAQNTDADILIVGNSRVEMGINPDHELFKTQGHKVFNLGLPGSGLKMQYGYALDVVRSANIKIVWVSVDFIDFLETCSASPMAWPPATEDFDKRKKYHWDGSENKAYWLKKITDLGMPLVSLAGISDSLSTLVSQKKGNSNLTVRGFNPAYDMEYSTRAEGVLTLFSQKNQQLVKSLTQKNWRSFYTMDLNSNKFALLDHFIKKLLKQQIQVRIFINPYHIQYLQVLYRAGLWQEFEKWKEILAVLASQYTDNVDFIDFSFISHYQTETVLNVGNKPLQWFWEPSHYRSQLGNIMVKKLMGNRFVTFGELLNKKNLEDNLATNRKLLELWQKENNEEVRYVNRFFESL